MRPRISQISHGICHAGGYLVDDFGGSVDSEGCRAPKRRRDDPALLVATAEPPVLLLDSRPPRYERCLPSVPGGSVVHGAPAPADPVTEFLRLSRSSIDDTITQNLNALETPARAGFDPTSTSQLGPRPISHQIDSAACDAFKARVLFPSWQVRSDVLAYCSLVATSPDPDDPERALRDAESEKDKERVVDERLDPYSARFFPREARTEHLAMILRQEVGIENIVRAKTWDIVRRRCGDPAYVGWEKALADWRRDRKASSQPAR